MRPIVRLHTTYASSINSANGIRTRVWALRGPRPSPLDDSAATSQQARQESNLQPPVLETGALPIELRTYTGCLLRITPRGRNAGLRSLSEGWLTGIEPATPGATDRCSNQLSYSHHEPPCILTALDNRINSDATAIEPAKRSVTSRDPCTRRCSDSRAPFRPCSRTRER